MKTIRLLYPDWLSGGLETYYFGANLLQHILPANPNQTLVKVDIPTPDGRQRKVQDGIAGKDEVLAGIRAAQAAIETKPRSGSSRSAAIVWYPRHHSIICTGFIPTAAFCGLMLIRTFPCPRTVIPMHTPWSWGHCSEPVNRQWRDS